jgi:alpha-glucosidase
MSDSQEVNVSHTGQRAAARDWWRTAAIYEVYLRSFADGNGDGIGDLAGVRARLPYLSELGIDAIWFAPWYPSPMADAGYDVADYRGIEPLFGSLDEAEKLIAEAHALGIRIIIDVVPNHGSDQQQWFIDALASHPGSAARARYHFRPGQGAAGSLPPNNWPSEFGGTAWSRVTGPGAARQAPEVPESRQAPEVPESHRAPEVPESHRAPEVPESGAEWYLNLFSPGQPDFNWSHPDVRAEFAGVLRFWFDRGVDGFRIDSAALRAKDPARADPPRGPPGGEHPYVDRDGVHDIYREWRRIADSYPGERVLIGEVWLPDAGRLTRYLRPDELHSAFNFDFLCCAWEAARLRQVIDVTLASHARVGAAPTWVLSNHDVVRHVTRYGRADTAFSMGDRRIGEPADLELGRRRARAAALLTFSLPGGVYLYQGDELGLWEVEDLPDDLLQDPIWERSGHTDRGRDGCRVPLPWSGNQQPFGFGPEGASPWLPQPAQWKDLTAEAQSGSEGSMLELYRAALRLRRDERAFASGEMRWLGSPADVLSYRRGDDITVVINLSAHAAELPPHDEVLISSAPLPGGVLPPDCAAWLRTR